MEKDALDVYLLLAGVDTPDIAAGIRRLVADDVSARATDEAMVYLGRLFGSSSDVGAQMAGSAAPQDIETVTQSASTLALDLLEALEREGDDVVPVRARAR